MPSALVWFRRDLRNFDHAALHHALRFADLPGPWRVVGGGLDATLVPFHNKRSASDFGVLSSRTDQVFGHWVGTFDTGTEVVAFEDIVGFGEDVHNRW